MRAATSCSLHFATSWRALAVAASPDPHAVLGVPANADQARIKLAFKQVCFTN